MNWVYILIIIISCFLTISILFFDVLFMLKRHNFNLDYKLKTKFNYYKNNPIGSNLKAIETLVKQNHEFNPILEYLRNCHLNYIKQLEIVYVQLQKTASDNQSWRLFSTTKKLKQINNNFNLLDKQQADFRSVNLDTQKYINSCSQIATDLFDALSSITTFNRNNLIDILHKDVAKLKTIDIEVNDISIQINKEINSINYIAIHSLFLKEIINIKNLFKISKQLFEIDKYLLVFDTLYDMIENIINTSKLNNEKIAMVRTKLAAHKQQLKNINLLLKNSSLDLAFETLLNELKTLETTLSSLRTEQRYLEIYNKHFDLFKNNVKYFYDLVMINNIKELYDQILQFFKHKSDITSLIHTNITLINNIYNKINEFNSWLHQKHDDHYVYKCIQYIYSIYAQMIEFKNENDQLLSLIKNEHKDFLNNIFALHGLELKLVDLDKLILEYRINNDELKERIKEYRNDIHKLQQALLDHDPQKYDGIKAQINSIDEFIVSSFAIVKAEINLIAIIKRLKLYANRYHEYMTKQQIANFQKLYDNHQYYALIDEYIDYIQKTKKQKRMS